MVLCLYLRAFVFYINSVLNWITCYLTIVFLLCVSVFIITVSFVLLSLCKLYFLILLFIYYNLHELEHMLFYKAH